MSVRDFPTRPQGSAPDSVPFLNWLDALGQRQNIDLLQELTSVASGDEIAIFDASETGNNKTKKATVANLAAAIGGGIGKNILINGGFRVNQRQITSSADDTYAHDQWYVLTQSNAIAVSTLTAVEDGLPYMARLTQSNASAQRMGYAQPIEGAFCKQYRGQTVTFKVGRYRYSNAAAVRFAVLEWTGTEDAITSDVVNDWTSSTYTAGNFFLGSNLTVSGVTSATPAAATLTDGPELTVTLGSSFNNLIVFVWTEGTAAQNSTLDLGKVKLEAGDSSTDFIFDDYQTELLNCKRYCIQYNSDASVYIPFHKNPLKYSTTGIINFGTWEVEMRVAPSISISAIGDLYGLTTGGGVVAGTGSLVTNNLTKYAGNIQFNVVSTLGGGAGDSSGCLLGPGAGKFLRIDASL